MSVVKTVKGRKAILEALSQEPKKKASWWEHKERILKGWLHESPEELSLPGALDLVRSQLERGSNNPSMRVKCWKHIVIELAALVEGDDTSPMPRRGSSASISGGAASGARTSTSESCESDEEGQEVGGGDAIDASLKEMSFLERQEWWLRRRKKTIEAKAQKLAADEGDITTFSPNVALSRSSMKVAQVSAMEHRMEEMANEAERERKRKSLAEEKKRAELERIKADRAALSSSVPSKGLTADDGSGASGSTADNSPLTLHQRRVSRTRRGKGPNRRASAPSALIDTTIEPVHEEDSEDEAAEHGNGTSAAHLEGLDEQPENLEEGQEEEEEEEGDKFEAGSFFTRLDDRGKGHYRIRDPGRFLLTSMYKRKDRVTRTAGVSLLVGKLEAPPHEEKVISAIFDLDRFTEEEASEWWEQNGHRFEDSKSLAEKQEMNRKGKLHGDAIKALSWRRFSAPVTRMNIDPGDRGAASDAGLPQMVSESPLVQPPAVVA
jgi:hypothetical protein